MGRVLVVGDVVDDIVVRPLAAVTAASDTRAQIRRTPGGSAANVAAWLGWCGATVSFVGRAGASGGDSHVRELARWSVDAHIAHDPELPTGTIVLMLDAQAERTMYVDRGANAALVPDDVPPRLWEDVDWLHLTGYSLFDDGVRPTALALVEAARSRGAGVSVDPSSVAFLRACGVERFWEWTRDVQVLMPNEDEAHVLTGETDPDEVVSAPVWGARTVVLTLGERGSLVRTADGRTYRVPAPSPPVMDTTGAGDAYCAGFLAASLRGVGARECATQGARASAHCLGMVGGRP